MKSERSSASQRDERSVFLNRLAVVVVNTDLLYPQVCFGDRFLLSRKDTAFFTSAADGEGKARDIFRRLDTDSCSDLVGFCAIMPNRIVDTSRGRWLVAQGRHMVCTSKINGQIAQQLGKKEEITLLA